ncbi:uncharacterized protein [Spinacia oleracea]|uniref:Uncharacterized protein n=1 Tax=Spinacia oleracea TaxID=3562 RepID=A0ABM3QQ25_SPIOL|nr:uncharacterized protein LOC130461401 [Spinacia oleracea]
MDLQMMLAGETFTSLDTLYGKDAHLYGLQQRRNGVGERRKDVGNQNQGGGQQHQGNFKKNKGNNHFQFKGNHGGNRNNFHNNNGNKYHLRFLSPRFFSLFLFLFSFVLSLLCCRRRFFTAGDRSPPPPLISTLFQIRLLQKQLEEEEKLSKQHVEALKGHYQKYEMIDSTLGDGTSKRLSKCYGVNLNDD